MVHCAHGTAHKGSQVNQPPGEVQIAVNKGRSQPQLNVRVVPGFLSRVGSSSAEPCAALQTHREPVRSAIHHIKHISKDKYITLGHGHTLKHRHITRQKLLLHAHSAEHAILPKIQTRSPSQQMGNVGLGGGVLTFILFFYLFLSNSQRKFILK